jgi:hypothetical protein
MRQLGLSENRVELGGKLWPGSRAIELLGSRIEPVKLVATPGKVMWVDFDLARELGFNVPPDNRMTPEFHQELIDALSFRLLREGEDPAGRTVIEGGADRYMGTGQGFAKGAGRTAFLPWLNVNIKGVGRTPLAAPMTRQTGTHLHGGAPAREGLLEAIWGLEADNVFTHKGTRILAVIDEGDDTTWSDGVEPRALIARVGNQYRPAHQLDYEDEDGFVGGEFTVPLFVDQARESGLLEQRRGVPDYRATMLNAVDRQAQLAAEQFRYRILHGTTSTSNMEWDGGLLDNGTTAALFRTEPARVLDFTRPFGTEHAQRAVRLGEVYEALVQQLATGTAPGAQSATPIDFAAQMQQRYEAHLAVQMLEATGFKLELAEEIGRKHPMLAQCYLSCLTRLAALASQATVNIDKGPAPGVSTVDIFHLLGKLPGRLFNEPQLDLTAAVRAELLVQGAEPPQLAGLIAELATLYPLVIDAALAAGGQYYDDPNAMKRSIVNRAAFENRRIDQLERAALGQKLNQAIDEFRRNAQWAAIGSPALCDPIRNAVDKTVAASVRSVEGLLRQGTVRRLNDGGLEVEARTIDGIDYSVRCYDTDQRRLHLSIPLQSDGGDGYFLPSLRVEGQEHGPHLYRDQLDVLSFAFTTGEGDWQRANAEVSTDERGQEVLAFDIPVLSSDVGTLEGVFHCVGRGDFWWHDGTSSNFRGYTYAVPDRQELAQLAQERTPEGPVFEWR